MTIAQLNEHPLNRAALERLVKEHRDGDADLMHLFSLTYVALLDENGEPPDPFSHEGKILRDWTAGRNLQAAALVAIEGALEPEDIKNVPLTEFADCIISTLWGEQCAGEDSNGFPK